MRWVANQINKLPSPIRHAAVTLGVLEAGIVVNAFVGAYTWPDIKTAAVAVPVAAFVGFIRWAQAELATNVSS